MEHNFLLLAIFGIFITPLLSAHLSEVTTTVNNEYSNIAVAEQPAEQSHEQHQHQHRHHSQEHKRRKLCTPCDPTTFFQQNRQNREVEEEVENKIVGKEYVDESTSRASVTAVDVIETTGDTCKIRVTKLEKVLGKCVELKGGIVGCQSDRYLDPTNEECGGN